MSNPVAKLNSVVKPYYEVIFNNDVFPTEVTCRLYIADEAQPNEYAMHQAGVKTNFKRLPEYREEQELLVRSLLENVSGASAWAKQQCALVKILK